MDDKLYQSMIARIGVRMCYAGSHINIHLPISPVYIKLDDSSTDIAADRDGYWLIKSGRLPRSDERILGREGDE